MSDPRVLVLTTMFPHRPGEKEGNFILDQVRALVGQGVDATVVVAKPWTPVTALVPAKKRPIDIRHYSRENFRLRNVSFVSLPRFFLGEAAYARAANGILPKLGELAQQSPFDVVHAHGLLMGHVANAAAKTFNVPSVVTLHGVETSRKFDNTDAKRHKIRDVLDGADQLVLVGSPLLDYLKKYSPRSERFQIVGNGCTVYTDLQASPRIPRKKPVRVIAVSNYEESKGFDLLVEAVSAKELRDKVELVIVGGGEGFGKIKTHLRDLGRETSVHFTGQLSHRKSLEEVLAADVFCLPSWREAFGIMYAEAMALGKLTIGCNGQGPSDFIRHLETGFLIEPGSTTAVAEALRWAIDNPEPAAELSERGRDYALRNLTWDANAAKMIDIYRTLITTRSSAQLERGDAASKR